MNEKKTNTNNKENRIKTAIRIAGIGAGIIACGVMVYKIKKHAPDVDRTLENDDICEVPDILKQYGFNTYLLDSKSCQLMVEATKDTNPYAINISSLGELGEALHHIPGVSADSKAWIMIDIAR